MNSNPKPPQFSLWSLFKLTTKIAVASAIYFWLPNGAQEVVATMLLLFVIAFGLLIFEIFVLVPCVLVPSLVLFKAIWRAAVYIIGPSSRRPWKMVIRQVRVGV